jgi:hypothetical protein
MTPRRISAGLDADHVMKFARLQMPVRRTMLVVALTAGALTLGVRNVSCSCHLCHNRKLVVSRLLLGFPISWHEQMKTQFPVEPNHRHIWSTFSMHTDNGFWGSGVACRSTVYIDGTRAPDGLR